MNTGSDGLLVERRAGAGELSAARERFLADALVTTLLNAIPELALVLNPQRQIVAVNRRVLEAVGLPGDDSLIGLRPGELLDCVHAHVTPEGCGTSPSCDVCGAFNAIQECLTTKKPSVRECRIRRKSDADGGAVDVEVNATFVRLQEAEYAVLALHDTSAEKRRSVLERTFFHDVLNIAAGLQAVSQLLEMDDDPVAVEEYKRDLRLMSQQIGDEITAQRQLLAAERGHLELNLSTVSAADLLESVSELYRHHTVARGRSIETHAEPRIHLTTDAVLARRVLGNLLKNALEASPEGGVVTMQADAYGHIVAFSVHNQSVMPPDVQKQVFQRSFSTKGGSGRGIGTHSVKLLTERYLGGSVSFTSSEPEGTTFAIKLPVTAPSG